MTVAAALNLLQYYCRQIHSEFEFSWFFPILGIIIFRCNYVCGGASSSPVTSETSTSLAYIFLRMTEIRG